MSPLLREAGAQLTAALPRDFVATARWVLLHRDEDRFMRLHRMIERLIADRRHWQDTLHPEHVHLQSLARQVRRDVHKMKAFVRFTRVQDAQRDRYIAWFEPEHDIVAAAAPFFARRFATMDWAILTPRGSVQWQDGRLQRGPPATRADAPPPDAGEALWLTYYARIFNPARIKVAAMTREMPQRYWKNLPEAALIAPLLAEAPQRVEQMVQVQIAVAREAGGARDAGTRRRGCGIAGGDATRLRPAMEAAASPASPAAADPAAMLEALQRRAASCNDCPCAAQATQTVWGEGACDARIVIVGEQPGDREDLEGRPFAGPAGALLDEALRELRWPRQSLYLTNAVKHFQYTWRGKRRMHKTPGQMEVQACARWLDAELQTVAPDLIIALGRTAERATASWADRVPIAVLPHPSALLRRGIDAKHPRFAEWVAMFRAAAAPREANPGA